MTVKCVGTCFLIGECIDSLADNIQFSTVDWNSGYYQLSLNSKDYHKITFITKFGLFEIVSMSFGLCNAPITFQRIVQLVFADMNWREVVTYLDDILVLWKSFKHHLSNQRKEFHRLGKHNFKLKPKKCTLFQIEIQFFQRKVGKKGVSINPKNNIAVSQTVQQLQSLGFVNYHRDDIKDFANITLPLYALMQTH